MPPPQPEPYDPTGIEHHTIPSFTFASGTTLHDLRVAYRQYNTSSTAGTVLIPTCFAGKINTTLTFQSTTSSALSKYHVVVVAMLSNGESSSPSNKCMFPAPGELHYEDLIHAQYGMLTDALGVKQLEAVIGFSMGGQQAYHWAVMYPDFVKRIVGICTSARTSGHNYAFLEGPIAAMTSSIDYVAWKQIKAKLAEGAEVGDHLKEVKPKKGLAAWARTYAAWLTSAQWFREREWEKMGCKDVEEWMDLREAGYAEWDADDLVTKARMWQMGDVGSTKKGVVSQLRHAPGDDQALEDTLKSIKAKVLLMPCRTDQYFPPDDSEDEMKHLKDGKLEVIESSWGHTAGGGANPADVAFMDAKLAEHMQR
ncbi:hypothetical protein LTR70_001201 [Exophiala xenobiotica]|uniref:AB hydrolase-1 domain-containing protein n=1 Tax=Lithohypha guttulata TaxID=1690604 RepID=A0ABR0KKE0_9EURO|nr:hypothetical protein LTR24_001452 [Lithohypha guttulata]KAK5328176.1 hypothetical protein LTR70_001201 [Exophiala xenobiotica]